MGTQQQQGFGVANEAAHSSCPQHFPGRSEELTAVPGSISSPPWWFCMAGKGSGNVAVTSRAV